MRTTCVKRVYLLFIAVVAAVISLPLTRTTLAQSTDPLLLPRLSFSDISYAGGFRLPAEARNGETFARGGQAMAFNAAGPSLFVSSRLGQVAEVNIPAPVISNDVTSMPFAQYLQGFADPVEGRILEAASWGVWTNSLMVHNGRLYGTASMYYDANNEQRVSHFTRSLRLNEPSFQGWTQVWETGKAGFVSGLLAAVPSEWQQRLGGAMVSGQCCIPVVSRTSWGPAAFAFDPTIIGQSAAAASPLLYYTGDHPTLGSWSGSNDTYGSTTEMGGLVLVAGTRTALYFGRNGLGPACYGQGTNDPNLHGTPVPPSGTFKYCYDPVGVDNQGTHAYPYQYQIWAYDLNDFAAVKAGTKQPWDVVPYGVWPFQFPTQEARVIMGGVSYDAARQTIYIAQSYADTDVYESRPIIHALKVNGTGTVLAPPAPPAAASTVITSVSIASNVSAPQVVGTPVIFSASAVGGTAPYQYKWMTTTDGVSWSNGTWATSNQFTWTPTAANPGYQVRVWARSSTNTNDQPESYNTVPYPIVTTASAVTSATFAANRTAPQTTGTAITFTATATGGVAPNQFKWLLSDGTATTVLANWSTTNTFTWTPGTANANYRVGVWARSAGNTADRAEAAFEHSFPITASTGATTPPSTTASPVTSAAYTTNKTAPQPTGTAITFTATATGGVAPNQFKWLLKDGTATTVLANWSTTNTFTWTPVTANANYRVSVWVRSAGNTADTAEAAYEQGFAITAPAAITPPPPAVTPPVATVSQLTLTANKMSPQATGTAIALTAQASGGVGPYQYQWSIFDGHAWVVAGTWTTTNTFSWTPSQPGPKYQVGVSARSAGSTNGQGEATAALPFVINNGNGNGKE